MKNPPHTYLQKLRSYLDPAVTRKVSAPANVLSCSTAAAFPFSPLDPLSLVQDIPTAEERFHTWLREQTAWELNSQQCDLMGKETVVYLKRLGFRNLCPS